MGNNEPCPKCLMSREKIIEECAAVAGVGAEAYKPAVIRCAVSHLPAGHPNACNDCDPCLMHDRNIQRDALWADWEGMYWEIRALLASAPRPDEERSASSPTSGDRTALQNDGGLLETNLIHPHPRQDGQQCDHPGSENVK